MNETMTPKTDCRGPAGLAMTEERTPEIIGAEIRALTASMLSNVIEIGRRMCEAKELLPHGSFGDWIRGNTGYGLSSANNFMKIFREYGGQTSLFGSEANSQTLGKLSYTKALALLAVPAEERESFAVSVDAEHISSRELEKAIAERDEAIRRAEEERAQFEASEKLRAELADEVAGTRMEIDAAKKKITELERRPVEVAISEPDPAEIERRAKEIADGARAEDEKKIKALEAEREAQKNDYDEKLKKLSEKAKKDREEMEQKIKEAEEKAAAAGAGDRAEAEKAKTEAEALRKQLSMSGAEMTVFKLRFNEWQAAYKAMRDALERIAEGRKDKCEAAIKAQIGAWSAAEEANG